MSLEHAAAVESNGNYPGKGIGQPVGPAGSEQTVQDVAGERPLALALPRARAGANREP